MIRGEVPPDQLEGVIKTVRSGIDALREQGGFKRGYLLVGRDAGRWLAVSIWESREALDARIAATPRLQLAGAVTPELYEVVDEIEP